MNMSKLNRIAMYAVLISVLPTAGLFGAEMPFHRGVNLTSWFQVSGPREIQFTKFTRQDLINIQSLGCDVIRLPINLHAMTGGEPNYTPDPLFLSFLDQVVDWAEELQIHLILDNHTFDVDSDTDPNIADVLVSVWRQMAEHYKDRSEYLYYEVLNEPHGIDDAAWLAIQRRVIDAIRSVDSTHAIIVGPAGWNGHDSLVRMSTYRALNLIYTFHFYDPFLFTHQGASWTNPSLVPLSGVPFPYDAARMPECPEELLGTWVEGALESSYRNDGVVQRIREAIDRVDHWKTLKNVPVFCGELGVYIPNSDPVERAYWYSVVRGFLEAKGIAWTSWDYVGGFGLFEKDANDLFEHDLNIPLIEALGLTPPEQTEFVIEPDTEGFEIYTDYVAAGVYSSNWLGDDSGMADLYWDIDTTDGQYCIYWTGSDRYCHVGFDFKPNKDLSLLLDEGFCFDVWIRGDTPGAALDVRFMDTDTGADDHPWRMRLTIDESLAAWDGTWQHVQVPLADFTEHGAWENDWFNPRGLFDWTAVDRLEIVSEHHDLAGVSFWFDQIRVLAPSAIRR